MVDNPESTTEKCYGQGRGGVNANLEIVSAFFAYRCVYYR